MEIATPKNKSERKVYMLACKVVESWEQDVKAGLVTESEATMSNIASSALLNIVHDDVFREVDLSRLTELVKAAAETFEV